MVKSKLTDKRKMQLPKHLQRLNLNAAGIDIGSRSHYVAVPEGADDNPVREFECFTADLYCLADWLISCGVTTVAMESTGTYWIPVFEVLESRDLDVKLVNARHVKNVPGRKTDVLDCQWIQQLHTYGLLEGAFRPPEQICELRAYIRHRMNQVRYSSAQIQHMQKALTQMNLLLHNVVSDITGVTGMRIIKAILDGERDTQVLAGMRDNRCKNSVETIAKSLQGNYRPEHLFSLKQAVQTFEFYQAQIAACDCEIETLLASFDSNTSDNLQPPANKAGKSSRAQNKAPEFNLKNELFRVTGVDLTKIDGIDSTTARLVYSMLKYGTEYTDVGQDYYEQRYKSRVIQNLKKRAQELGFTLIKAQTITDAITAT